MNTQEREKIRKMREDARAKYLAADRNKHDILKAKYQAWMDALEWVLMEV